MVESAHQLGSVLLGCRIRPRCTLFGVLDVPSLLCVVSQIECVFARTLWLYPRLEAAGQDKLNQNFQRNELSNVRSIYLQKYRYLRPR